MKNKINDLKSLNETVISKLKSNTSDLSFNTLFANDSFILKSIDNNKATFVTDLASSATFINQSNYPDKIKRILDDLTSDDLEVNIISNDEFLAQEVKKDTRTNSFEKKVFPNCSLVSTYTFDNFIVGPSNKQAYLASIHSIDYPGKYNPIFLYSKSGLGKTHLLYAIGNKYKEKYPDRKVQYITTNTFVDTIFNHFRNNQNFEIEAIKNYFYGVDLLLIDDIQFLADKTTTQMIFFDIFNILVSTNKQIVITSDRSPIELKGLEDRLVTRFSGGLSLSIQAPDKKTLRDILNSKIQIHGYSLDVFDDDALDYLAMHHSKNVRELEGALTTLLFNMATLKPQGHITLEFVQSVFQEENIIIANKGKTTINTIIDDVASYYSLTSNQLRSKVRTSQIALARQIAMYLSRSVLNLPYQAIGREFQKDHSTVVANVTKIEDQMKKDATLKRTINELTKIVSRKEA